MQQWSPTSYLLEQVINLVKIHGNWCGPNWTGGQKVSASDYTGSWSAPAQDWLDRCCRRHDKSCAEGGCTTAADRRMIKCIDNWYKNPLNPVFHPIMNIKAQLVREGIRVASLTRSN